MKSTNQYNYVKEENAILVHPYQRGFDSKEEAMQHIERVSSYLETVNVWNTTKLNSVKEKAFIQLLESGTPHRLGSCLESKMSPRDVQDYRTNIFCFDIDDLEHLPERALRKAIALLHQYFHYVQESFSSGRKLSQKRFHCYLVVTTLQVDYEVLALIYKRLRDDLSAKIGLQFDESMYPLKNIFASGKKVKVNKTLKIFDLKPYLDSYMEDKIRLNKKEGREVEDRDVVNYIVDEGFNKRLTTTRVSFNELLQALKSEKMPFIADYKEWIRYLMAFNDMEREGLITTDQKSELAEAIDDGNQGYLKEFEKVKRYDEVTIGSLIYRLQLFGIPTNHIFTLSESYELRTDISLDIQGKITENPDVYRKIVETISNTKNRGKRILLYSETGTGKSTAILKVLEDITNLQIDFNPTEGFSILSIPRRNLINNLRNKFEKIRKSSTITGSDKYASGERKKAIQDSRNILTTLDHNPYVSQFKLGDNNVIQDGSVTAVTEMDYIPNLMVLDECHMLSSDATFKEETIREYCIAETALLNAGGISLHITGTPENLRSEDYDLIIKINQLDRVNPFKNAGYLMLDGTTKQVEKKMLEVIKMAAIKNKERRLLVFIERKETISDFSIELNKLGIRTMEVVSKKEELKSKEEISVVSNGLIPNNIQVILATTSLSAGVSIENNHEVDEVWVFCSNRSLNHEMTRIAQMSHRFRNTYHALKLFIQKGKQQEKKKFFLYQTYLNEEIKKAEDFKKAIRLMRDNKLGGRVTLDELEMQNGLFADDEGNLHVCTPLIQSEIVLNKTYYNFNNPHELIRELQKKFQCEFVEMQVNGAIEIEEVYESNKFKKNETSKEILKKIVSDELLYKQLKSEYFLRGKSEFSRLLKGVKKSTISDLTYFFKKDCDFTFVRQVMKAHLNTTKDETLSYRRDLGSLKELNKILNSDRNSLSLKMYNEITRYITLSGKTKNPIEFSRVKDIEPYLKAVATEVLKDKGYDSDLKKVESFKKLLWIKKGKTGGNWIYTIEGFVDENKIKEKYGIDMII
ncbi:DEAD/DEAH box helicase family protein [Ornithinibacillus contaminans]|uniref:DEAD/DEAH box helicase family protein n=1 Tax=Ornithinibacillus contaminans TaxID=694055 RepID=UPI00064DAE6E|nr:DEAD/DEAH box helicase family protein [Ornithinibacillus contaminans]